MLRFVGVSGSSMAPFRERALRLTGPWAHEREGERERGSVGLRI